MPPADRFLLVRAAAWLGLSRLALGLFPLRSLLTRIERMRRSPEAPAGLEPADRIAWAVEVASR